MTRSILKVFAGGVVLATAISFSGHAFASFEGFGKDIPLESAVKQISPSGWSIDYGEGVDKALAISWSSAPDWKQALRDAVSKRGYSASYGENTVVISKVATVSGKPYSSTPAAPVRSSKPKASPAPSKPIEPKIVAATVPAPAQGGGGFTIRPYNGGGPAKSENQATTGSRLVTKGGGEFEAYKPVENPAPSFTVAAGQMLHPSLAEWASKAGWRVIWESEYDYKIEADARFNGDFIKSVTSIVTAMADARPAITVEFYKENSVVVISNKSADAVN